MTDGDGSVTAGRSQTARGQRSYGDLAGSALPTSLPPSGRRRPLSRPAFSIIATAAPAADPAPPWSGWPMARPGSLEARGSRPSRPLLSRPRLGEPGQGQRERHSHREPAPMSEKLVNQSTTRPYRRRSGVASQYSIQRVGATVEHNHNVRPPNRT